ncbi:MAG: hypothetical protein OXT51_06890 [Chloroflexota bacterium]|nr:hypothetical protein [Chloroflexota bacterium]
MTLYSRVCLRCGGLQHWLHRCRADVMVVDPVMLQADWERTNPLDRLSMSDWLRIQGQDAEEERRKAEAEIQAANDAYFSGSLTYRVELHSLTGTGFQGGFDHWSIQVESPRDAALLRALDFINTDGPSPIALEREHRYLCKLVSLDKEGIKYVWSVREITCDGAWQFASAGESA